MKSHRRRALAAGSALLLSLTLAGCGQADPRAAAVVGDRVVPESDVNTAVQELREVQLPQQLDAPTVTQFLAFGPLLTENLRQAGVPVSDDDARRGLENKNAQLSRPSLDVLRTMVAIGAVQQAGQMMSQPQKDAKQSATAQRVLQANEKFSKQVQQSIDDGSFTMNPKYGKQPPNWVMQNHAQGDPGGPGQVPDQAPQETPAP